MPSPFASAVIAASAWALLGLALLRSKARGYGTRVLYAAPKGDPAAGVRYAFTGAMAPGAKESVREHLPSYLLGLLYHAGIFTALALLATTLGGWAWPQPLRLPIQILLGGGAMAGLGLLVKRLWLPELRGLSHPDDFVANGLATVFVALAFAGPLHAWPLKAWLLSAILLLLYVPLGKLRHCFFFFVARRHLGAFFGRRGVFPTEGSHGR
jgi:hypothetical protein